MTRRLAPAAVIAAILAVVACSDLPTGPGGRGEGGSRPVGVLAFAPEFAFQGVPGAPVVRFQRVRVVLRRGTTVVLDEVREFPGGAQQAEFSYDVPLLPGTGTAGETFQLTLELLGADGTVLFRGEQPVTITPTPPGGGGTPPPPISVPVQYAGPGATAARVVLTPAEVTLAPGATQQFTATAQDASGAALPGTPIGFTASTGITVTPTGLVTAGSARTTATVTAVLLTGPTASATVRVVPPPANLLKQGGDGQTAPVGTALAQPLAVRVTAADGVGSPGVAVTFSTTAGTLGATTVTTGSDGTASTTLTLPPTPGAVTVTASAPGLSGSPQSFTATAVAGPVDRLVLLAAPTTGQAGVPLGPLTVEARDRFGNRATTATGDVTVAATDGPGTLSGPTTQPLVGGQATFAGLTLSRQGSYTLTARFGELSVSAPVTIAQGPATQLVVVSPPSPNPAPTTTGVSFTVAAQDVGGDVVVGYTGTATVTVQSGPGPISGTTAVGFLNGQAQFAGLRFPVAGSYTLRIASGSLSTTASLTIIPPPTASFTIVSGNGQTGAPGDSLPTALRVRLLGPGSVPLAGRTVAWTNATPAGTFGAPPPQTTTDAGGYAQATYKLGPTPGTYVVTVTTPDAPGTTLTFTLTAATAASTTWTGAVSSDWFDPANWSSGVPGSSTAVTIPDHNTTPYDPLVSGLTAVAGSLTLQNLAYLSIEESARLTTHGDVTLGMDAELAYPGYGGLIAASPNVSRNARRAAARNLARRRAAIADTRRVDRRSRLTEPTLPLGSEPILRMAGSGAIAVHFSADIAVLLQVSGTVHNASTTGPLDVPALWVTDGGLFDNNGLALSTFDLVTVSGGRLQATAANSITTSDAKFYGGSTAGLLNEGTLTVLSRFEQGGDPQSFAPAGTFTVSLRDGASVEFTTPGLPGSGSYFHQLAIPTGASVTLYGSSVGVADGDGGGGGPSFLSIGSGAGVSGPATLVIRSALDGFGSVETAELHLAGPGNQMATFEGTIASPTTRFVSGTTSTMSSEPTWNTNLVVGSGTIVSYPHDAGTAVTGGIHVESGQFRITGSAFIDVGGDFQVASGSGSFFQVAGSVLRVEGNVAFRGAPTALSAGTIALSGHFEALGGSFAATGSHQVTFEGSASQTLSTAGSGVTFGVFYNGNYLGGVTLSTGTNFLTVTSVLNQQGVLTVPSGAQLRVTGTLNRYSGSTTQITGTGTFCANTIGVNAGTTTGTITTPCP